MRANENEIKNSAMFKRWNNIKNEIPQKIEDISVGEIKNNETNKELYDEYDEIYFSLENDVQHCDHYFYVVTGKYKDSGDYETIYVVDDNVKEDGEWARKFKQHSKECYNELIKHEIEWDMEKLEHFEKLYGDNMDLKNYSETIEKIRTLEEQLQADKEKIESEIKEKFFQIKIFEEELDEFGIKRTLGDYIGEIEFTKRGIVIEMNKYGEFDGIQFKASDFAKLDEMFKGNELLMTFKLNEDKRYSDMVITIR